VNILKYGVRNFFCFREALNVSFSLGANCPKSISYGKNFTNVLGVKGANASGKTNALKALSFLAEVCCNSFSYKPDARIYFEPFYNSKKPTDFFIDFVNDGVEYSYELSLTRRKIISETLFRKINRKVKVIERINDDLVYLSSDFRDLEGIKVRSNASIISTSNQYEIKSLKNIYRSFNQIISNVSFDGYSADDDVRHLSITKFYSKNKAIFKAVKTVVNSCDTGVDDIQIETSKDKDGEITYYPIFMHKVDGKLKKLGYSLESSGTKALYNQIAAYILVLRSGGILILDEFDNYLHPHLLPLILNLYLDPEVNKRNAQLIFTTHNTEIIDYLGKYRMVLINKEKNESFGYRLDEIPGDMIRNDRPIVPLYDAGKIGGVGNYDL
jgi:AAA15 family ATPase/GTPase